MNNNTRALTSIFICLWLMIAAVSYQLFDVAIAEYFYQLKQPQLSSVAIFITKLGYAAYPMIAILMLFIYHHYVSKRRDLAFHCLFLLLALIASGLVCDVFKIILSRARPIELFHDHIFGFQYFSLHARFWSFPSGHSTTIAALMTGMSLRYQRLTPLFVSLAILVGGSRIVLCQHYLSDVMVGLCLGTTFTWWLFHCGQHYLCKLLNIPNNLSEQS